MKKTLLLLMVIAFALFGFVGCDDSIPKAGEEQIEIVSKIMEVVYTIDHDTEGVTVNEKDSTMTFKDVNTKYGILNGVLVETESEISFDFVLKENNVTNSFKASMNNDSKQAIATINGKKYLITEDMFM